LFSIFKALTAIRLAEHATRAGVDCVPVFWLATQDHDLEEANQVLIPGTDGSLQKFVAATEGGTDAPLGNIRFNAEIASFLDSLASLLGDSEAVRILREAYRPGETFGSAFASLYAHIFADSGLILLEPADVEFHQLAQPLYKAAVERSDELNGAL